MYVVRGVWGWPCCKAVTCMLVTRPRAFCADILIISCVVSMDTEQFVKFWHMSCVTIQIHYASKEKPLRLREKEKKSEVGSFAWLGIICVKPIKTYIITLQRCIIKYKYTV